MLTIIVAESLNPLDDGRVTFVPTPSQAHPRPQQEERNKEATDGAIIMTSLESADPWLFPVNVERGGGGQSNCGEHSCDSSLSRLARDSI